MFVRKDYLPAPTTGTCSFLTGDQQAENIKLPKTEIHSQTGDAINLK
jgi:hypothetical protein